MKIYEQNTLKGKITTIVFPSRQERENYINDKRNGLDKKKINKSDYVTQEGIHNYIISY